jgi:hypothetical protein
MDNEYRRALRMQKKFLYYFPHGFYDQKYLDWERNYKWDAHLAWKALLGRQKFESLFGRGEYQRIAATAVRIESRTNLLFSFEKMALRDAVKTERGATQFSKALFAFLHGSETPRTRFANYVMNLAELPRKQTRVLTWPLATVWFYSAAAKTYFFEACGYP